jgi:hypothetical protein
MYIKYTQGLCQSRLSTADYALFLVASATTAVTVTQYTAQAWTAQKMSLPLLYAHIARDTCPQSCSLAMTVVLSPV